MARISGPLMSLTASGTISKTITYANWKGIDYARTRVIPANPRSIAQTSTRDVFTYLSDVWKQMPAIGREPWVRAAQGQPLTAPNVLLSRNISTLRDETDLTLLIMSPGAGGGLPPTDMTVTPGTDQLTVAITAPTAPAGWTLTAAQAIAFRDQDPHEPLVEPPIAGEDLTSTYSIVLTGLTTGELYRVGGWLKWLTATNSVAYSTALHDSGTPT